MARTGRLAREAKTIEAMISLYCRRHHIGAGKGLCRDCGSLRDYALLRLERCRFADAKPVCAKCAVHCYRPDARAAVKRVMRWSGPRMVWRHPILAFQHLLDGKRGRTP